MKQLLKVLAAATLTLGSEMVCQALWLSRIFDSHFTFVCEGLCVNSSQMRLSGAGLAIQHRDVDHRASDALVADSKTFLLWTELWPR